MTPKPTPAQRLRAQYALYPIHRAVGIEYEELNPGGQRTVDKVARLVAEIENPIRELHRSFGIYDECGHDHEDGDATGAIFIEEVGLTCADGLMYRVCTECCLHGGDYQTEECATNHKHGKDEPICATIAALEKRHDPLDL